MTNEPSSLNELLENYSDTLIEVKSTRAEKWSFVPYAYDCETDEWVGIARRSSNNTSPQITRRKGSTKTWRIKAVDVKIWSVQQKILNSIKSKLNNKTAMYESIED